ncbi:hypothetical protein KP509_22G059500 [Ceratopteris richardii]|uniref:Uncharacterized protein n=1 Tax=Ceratopteris richardii TaxID=49495 RepID=A0A8T2S8C7_CERRI|nr:hypothetical protein KP509_22G059500 [Ceratopteris richardii]
MSHITFDIQLQEAMQELVKLLEDDDPKVVLKGIQEYSVLYVRYIQIYRKMEDCFDQIVHAQKRIDLRRTLEACIGRILELRHVCNSDQLSSIKHKR